MANELVGAIDAVLEEKSMLKHPFYSAWNEGKLHRQALKEYACQYYHFVKDFPRMVSAVHSNTPDISLRQELLSNLIEEEQGSENHPALWMRFSNAMGASDTEVMQTKPLPSTAALVESMMKNCRSENYLEGVAALYGYESQIPEVSRVKIEGLQKFYGMSDPEAIKFFSVHQEADVYHSRSEREMLEVNTPDDQQQQVVAAAEETADALWNFLDGVYAEYVHKTVC